MSDKITRAEELANKLLNKTITPEEEIELNLWYNQNLDEKVNLPLGYASSEEAHRKRMLSAIQAKTGLKKPVQLWQRIAAAASIIMILSAGGYFLLHKSKPTQEIAQLQIAPIKPGGNKAILTLANGQKISLTDAANGNIASQSGVTVKKTAAGQLLYAGSNTAHSTEAIDYNTIETPKGGQYRVELSDGTVAWLNAASSLKYPSRFSGKERVVELSGEGYFQVAKDKSHPFIVQSKNQSVEVLGTHFNINAYDDEVVVKSTLLEGSIKVTADGKSRLLKPGQQSVLANSGLKVTEGNTEEAVAWKNGYFRFNDEDIESIMRKVSRWYDVEVVYQGAKTSEGFNGAITRLSNIEDVLKIMERSKAVHFKIQGRRVIVEK